MSHFLIPCFYSRRFNRDNGVYKTELGFNILAVKNEILNQSITKLNIK